MILSISLLCISTIETAESDSDDESPGKKRLRFVQLYTSKSYESHRNELLIPPSEKPASVQRLDSTEMIEQHVLSPRLVDAVSGTAQVVWANTKRLEGLTGRSDIPLQTAVGMPVAMDSKGNMCVVVMFSPHNMQSTDDAMEFLRSISQSATSSSIPCLVPVFDPKTSGMRRLPQLLPPQQKLLSRSRSEPASLDGLGEDISYRFVSFPDEDMKGAISPASEPERHGKHELTTAPKDTFGIPMLPSFAEIGNVSSQENIDAFDEASYGVWNTIMSPNAPDVLDGLNASQDYDICGDLLNDSTSEVLEPATTTSPSSSSSALTLRRGISVLQEDSRRERLEEFCQAFLGMSVFDLADVWVPSGDSYPDSLRVALSVSSPGTNNEYLNDFRWCSETSLIKHWTGAVGRAFSSGNPVWSANPNVFVDPGRAPAFQSAKIKAVLAVPVFSGKQTLPTCVVACYSLVSSGSVPFVLRFVQQALRLLWDGLDQVEPHESVNKDIWNDVGPADLGEMAADVEMQRHFMSKKRPRSDTVVETTTIEDPDTTSLAAQVQSVRLPDGEVINVPLQLTDDMPLTPFSQSVQNHLADALKSVGDAVRFENDTTKPKAAKRPHLMGPISGRGEPLRVPKPLPTHVFSRNQGIPTSRSKPQIFNASTAKPVPVPRSGSAPPSTASSPTPTVPLAATNMFAVSQNPYMSVNIPSVDGIYQQSIPLAAGTQYCAPATSAASKVTPYPSPPLKLCRIQGCDEAAVSRRPYCLKHSGNRLCEHAGCKKCAQGSTRFCIAHGGGRRCTFPGCDKGARDKFFCAAHGGGKRCTHEGCTKSAVGGSKLCTAHGGGRRCAVEGCDKSAQSSTRFCVKHGGGKKCAHENCDKVARGRTKFCAAHGGGIRCKLEGCNRVAIGKMQLCRVHGGGSSRGRKTGASYASNPSQAFTLKQTQASAGQVLRPDDSALLGGIFPEAVQADFMTV